MLGRSRSKTLKKRLDQSIDEDELFSTEERLEWLYFHTEWASDFDPEKHARTMLKIWEAEKIPDQRWTVTCKRRRSVGGIRKIHKVHVETLHQFPSRHTLETVALSMGFGGGEYFLTSKKGRKHTQRVILDGDPDDPFAVPVVPSQDATKEDSTNRFETELWNFATEYLKTNPVLRREVGLQYLAKELGIKIKLPDRNDPVPYSDLPVEYQDWLDENPDAKDTYMRMLLGIEEPELEPTVEERVVDGIKDKAVESAISSFGEKQSEWGKVLNTFLAGNQFHDVLDSLVRMSSEKAAAASGESRSTNPVDPDGLGT